MASGSATPFPSDSPVSDAVTPLPRDQHTQGDQRKAPAAVSAASPVTPSAAADVSADAQHRAAAASRANMQLAPNMAQHHAVTHSTTPGPDPPAGAAPSASDPDPPAPRYVLSDVEVATRLAMQLRVRRNAHERTKLVSMAVRMGNTHFLADRHVVVEWMFDLGSAFGLQPRTQHLAVHFGDMFVARRYARESAWQVLAMACLLMASKIIEKYNRIPMMMDMIRATGDNFDAHSIRSMELVILEILEWNPLRITAYEFLTQNIMTMHRLESVEREQNAAQSSQVSADDVVAPPNHTTGAGEYGQVNTAEVAEGGVVQRAVAPQAPHARPYNPIVDDAGDVNDEADDNDIDLGADEEDLDDIDDDVDEGASAHCSRVGLEIAGEDPNFSCSDPYVSRGARKRSRLDADLDSNDVEVATGESSPKISRVDAALNAQHEIGLDSLFACEEELVSPASLPSARRGRASRRTVLANMGPGSSGPSGESGSYVDAPELGEDPFAYLCKPESAELLKEARGAGGVLDLALYESAVSAVRDPEKLAAAAMIVYRKSIGSSPTWREMDMCITGFSEADLKDEVLVLSSLYSNSGSGCGPIEFEDSS